VYPWNKDTVNGYPRHQVIDIWYLNLKKKRKEYLSENPHHPWYELNLEDEILVRGVECNIPEI
jgi:hypothetical protein